MVAVVAIVAGVGAATALALQAFQENLLYFYSPTQVLAGEAPADRQFRVGGLVEKGSLRAHRGTLEVRFVVTDYTETVPVSYAGVLPDLFREGRASLRMAGWTPTGGSWPKKCSRSTTRTTCRPKSPSRCTTPTPGAGSSRMIPELGHFALILALLLCDRAGVLRPRRRGARQRGAGWRRRARRSPGSSCSSRSPSACWPGRSSSSDFSVAVRRQQLQLAAADFLPLRRGLGRARRLAAAVGRCALRAGRSPSRPSAARLAGPFRSRVLGVLGLVSIGFQLFILSTSNPFERLVPAALDGHDLNPLLQDFALAVHPPMLYLGYVGFSVAFAFAFAALLEGRLDAEWARWTRPWTIAAWMFLTVGIALGSWWAYYELGWGGWWFWDPVENASFMPWLVGTALIHSLAVTEKRGLFKSWTLLLAITAFSLTLLGTFLVRSGVLVSVHAFATDPARGLFILAFLAVVIGGALALYAWRAPRLKSRRRLRAGLARDLPAVQQCAAASPPRR